MSNLIMVVVRENYVIDRLIVAAADVPTFTYANAHDFVREDVNENIHLGDWYEASEDSFYRPITAVPPDWPAELDHLKPNP